MKDYCILWMRSTLGIIGLSLPDGTIDQMGKGHLIVTPNGQAITPGPADGVAVGTNIGKGGSGGGGGYPHWHSSGESR